MHPSQHCQICWRGKRAHWEVWDVNALLDLAIISGKGQRRGAPGGWGVSELGQEMLGTQGNLLCRAGLSAWGQGA